ncbi:hypothetical protein AAFC00_004126 [Neodothiora populina]|uniref:Anaphase-promoting complex subunit 1 n=1 Tax=Neodothiora populina TaxID=2781224 RepID=A0ABR3PIY6_9PEZI
MADVVSLGLNRPSALSYLISESIIPETADSTCYHWLTRNSKHDGDQEEVLYTADCVVWSIGGNVRKVYRFASPEQKVCQALLTSFPHDTTQNQPLSSGGHAVHLRHTGNQHAQEQMQRTARWGSRGSDSKFAIPLADCPSPLVSRSSRALVIVLMNEVQIHYLSGPSRVVNLPFEVQQVFASYQGIVIQRKLPPLSQEALSPNHAPPPPPPPPPPPHPSFASQSCLSLQPSANSTLPDSAWSLDERIWMNPQFEALFNVISTENSVQGPGTLPMFYSLANPLSDFAPVSHVLSRISRFSRAEDPDDMIVDYDPMDQDEQLIYMSTEDELASVNPVGSAPLLFMVTLNSRTWDVNVWQAWYLKPQNLSDMLAQKAAHKAARIRQGDSQTSGTLTGLTTPAIRQMDRARESLAASIRLPTESAMSQYSGTSRQLPDGEESMELRMDPDYMPIKRSSRAPTRVSSMLSRIEAPSGDPSIRQTALGASFGGGGRRGPSIGSFHDRRSFGSNLYRKSRGSTPGSVFGRSIGAADDHSEGGGLRLEDEYLDDEYASAGRLIGATLQSGSLDSAFGCGPDGLRKEMVTRKLDSIPLHRPEQPNERHLLQKGHVRVFTLLSDLPTKSDDRHIDIHVLDRDSGNVVVVSYRVRKQHESKPRDQAKADPEMLPIPVMDDRKTVSDVHDVATYRDGNSNALIYSMTKGGLRMVPAQGLAYPIYLPQKLRLSDPTHIYHMFDRARREVGHRRTISLPDEPFNLGTSRHSQEIMIATPSGDHRLRLLLSPRNIVIKRILKTCQIVLRGREGRSLPMLWCSVYQRFAVGKLRKPEGSLDIEWEALIVALFAVAVGSIGRSVKPRSHAHHLEPKPGDPTAAYDSQLTSRSASSETRTLPKQAWGWLQSSTTPKKRPTPKSRTKSKQRMHSSPDNTVPVAMSEYEAVARHFLHDVATHELEWLVSSDCADARTLCASKLMLALHLFREESKLDITFESPLGRSTMACLSAIIAQFGHWLGFEEWDLGPQSYYDLECTPRQWELSSSTMRKTNALLLIHHLRPPSIYEWIGQSLLKGNKEAYLTLEQIASIGATARSSSSRTRLEKEVLPRSCALQQLAGQFDRIGSLPETAVEVLAACGLTSRVIATLPEAVLAPIREAITRCQSKPPTTWPSNLLQFIGREDLLVLAEPDSMVRQDKRTSRGSKALIPPHDMQTIYTSADRVSLLSKSHEADRHAIVSLIFSEDRRFVDALRLLNPTLVQVAECPPQPEWSEVEHLDQQKRVMNWVMVRTIALAPGFAMVHFESQRPLLSEHFAIKGFSTSCQMKPMDTTITADRTTLTEDKFGWAFFHSGVSAGLTISQNAKGIDTSWIVFNKPHELGNRHAGFLLALGINGHLRNLAKWLAFKYLTPKHNMTSVGLLLGLSASHIGSMDTLITRMLSVHITRMLPPGAAELNVSPSTQTAGLMGIGLLYYNTQHRRMSEVMLSEIEHREIEDPGSTMDVLRDESYRLAAGFALGYINLGKGRNLQGLRSMRLLERLLNVAIGPRPVDLVHVVDKATAGAVIAIALIYMKTGDQSVAQKITVPDTVAQLEHVRPDMLLLRTVAKHLIMWNDITGRPGWIRANLPQHMGSRYYGHDHSALIYETARSPQLKSADVPFFNVVTGLAWSLSLRFAGSGNQAARDDVLGALKLFITVAKQEAFYYDAKLARNTVRRCIDVLALAAATIMAGTGDLETFRYLRSLHGRIDPETSYGSHMATHLAIGALFLGGGTYTFGTSIFAIAALLCAFYPLFPSDVSDNRVHLQAFRHFWVFAAEPRCLVVQDIDTARPIDMNLSVVLRDGTESFMTAPCLLPEIDTIARISTHNPAYWQVTIDFATNPDHISAFRQRQTIFVRRSYSYDSSSTVFSSALASINDVQTGLVASRGMWKWILSLPAFSDFDQTLLDLILPADVHSAIHLDEHGTVYDTRLALMKSVAKSHDRDALWNLRLLFQWAQDSIERSDGHLRWIGRGTVNMLRANVSQRMQRSAIAA